VKEIEKLMIGLIEECAEEIQFKHEEMDHPSEFAYNDGVQDLLICFKNKLQK
jgi:hypothetical protein